MAIETATIPEAATIPGAVAYKACVRLGAAQDLLSRVAVRTDAPIETALYAAMMDLYEAAFGVEQGADPAFEDQIEEDGRRLMLDCLGLGGRLGYLSDRLY
jgi:hypothetical protein